MGQMVPDGPMSGWWPWHGGWGLLLLLALVVLAIWVVVGTSRNRGDDASGTSPRGEPPRDPALEALRERFARGEIDRDEYEERRRVLGG